MKQKNFHEKRTFRFKRFERKAYSAFNSMHKLVSIGVVVGCALTFFPTSPVAAQTRSEGQEKILEEELEEVMVTASRVEMPIAQTAKMATVITKDQIERAPIQSIQDLLVYTANIDVIQRGGHGVLADISIRGGSGDQTAVLLNGINISNPHTGHYNFDIPINVSDIERIEILHGPAALTYGTGAFSGGINIITKTEPDAKAYAKVESGMHKLRGIELRGASKIGKTSNSLSVGNRSSAGYIANSDYDIYNALWQTRLHLKDESKVDFQLGYNDKTYGANTFYSAKYPNQYERTSTYMATVKGEFGTRLKFVPIIYWNRHHDQFDLIKDTDTGRNHHRNDTYGTNLILSYQSQYGATTLGGELRREDIMSSLLGRPMVRPHRKYTKQDNRTNASLALEHTLPIRRFVLSAGALLNRNSLDDKTVIYPSASVSYRPTDEFKIASSWSKSSRMPTFTDLSYTTTTHEGNAELKSEKSESVDLSLKYDHTLIQMYATGFLMWGRDIIDWVKINTPEGSKYASWNHTKLNTQGVEAGVKLNLVRMTSALGQNASLSVNYTRMHQSVDTDNQESRFALAYLRDKLTTQFNHQLYKSFSLSWFLRYQKRMGEYERYVNLESVGYHPYSAFSTLDLKLSYRYESLKLHVDLNNLYNTDSNDIGNIPQPGFWLMGGISYTFK